MNGECAVTREVFGEETEVWTSLGYSKTVRAFLQDRQRGRLSPSELGRWAEISLVLFTSFLFLFTPELKQL
jgi:hypothetical protein